MDSFSNNDIQKFKDSLPPRITPLKGALKIHLLSVNSNGEVRGKCLPTDPVYFAVKTDSSFNPLPNNRARLNPVNVIVYPEEGVEE